MTIAVSIEEIKWGATHAKFVSSAYAETAHPNAIYGVIDRSSGIEDDYDADISKQLANAYETTAALAGSVDVINWSFGDPRDESQGTEYTNESVIEGAFEKGTAVVTAAGNSNRREETPVSQRSPYDFTIGSISTNGVASLNWVDPVEAEFEPAWYNNTNPMFVDFYTYGNNGTSYSAPRVAGYITHILENNPNASLSEIRTVLEKNSKYMETGDSREPWTIQVLDPYDFENNLVRDGAIPVKHEYAKIFLEDAPRDEYEFNFDFDASIDAGVRVEAAYEVLFGRNPDQEGLDYWTQQVVSEEITMDSLIQHFTKKDEFVLNNENETEVALIEQVQGLYHLFLGRESTDEEVDMCIDYISENQLTPMGLHDDIAI